VSAVSHRLRRAAPFLAVGCLAALVRLLLRARTPDDYDSWSFLLGMRDEFDLASFQPQFPGYPVYVGLGRALIRLGTPPFLAPTLISSIASGATCAALAFIAHRLAGMRAALATAAFYLVAWLPLLLGSGMLSESLAAALAASALALLFAETPRPLAGGLLAGLLLGTRASYFPLVLSLVVFAAYRARLRGTVRHLAGLSVGIALWLPAFLATFGARALISLGTTHLRGHFEDWGNTIVTRPGLLARLGSFLRDLFYDGLVPSGWRLACIGAAAAIALGVCLARFSPPPRLGRARAWALFFVPYAAWAFFAQNILFQPRHVLPLVLGLVVLLGTLLAAQPVLLTVAVALCASVSLPLAWQRHTVPSAPAQAAAWAAERYGQDGAWTAIYAIRSARFFHDQARDWPSPWVVDNRRWLSDIYVGLARLDRFPKHILLTDEIDQLSGGPKGYAPHLPGTIFAGPRFCRDPRIDRAIPCLQMFELSWRLQ
jgi:hypothetical protein